MTETSKGAQRARVWPGERFIDLEGGYDYEYQRGTGRQLSTID